MCVCLYFFSLNYLPKDSEKCYTEKHIHDVTEQMPPGPCVSLLGLSEFSSSWDSYSTWRAKYPDPGSTPKRLLWSLTHSRNNPGGSISGGQELVYYLNDKSAFYVSFFHGIKVPISFFRALQGGMLYTHKDLNKPSPTAHHGDAVNAPIFISLLLSLFLHLPSGNDPLTDTWAQVLNSGSGFVII